MFCNVGDFRMQHNAESCQMLQNFKAALTVDTSSFLAIVEHVGWQTAQPIQLSNIGDFLVLLVLLAFIWCLFCLQHSQHSQFRSIVGDGIVFLFLFLLTKVQKTELAVLRSV